MAIILKTEDWSTEQFSFKDNTFVAEASDLRYGYPYSAKPRRIYDDACDVGICLRSHVTGALARFYLSSRDEREGEVMGTWFLPIAEDVRKNPKLKNVKVLIIND